MALRTDIKQEKVAIDVIARGSVLGKHIANFILKPILDDLEKETKVVLDDLGFMIVAEIQHRLATAPAGNTYKVYMINESVRGKGRYTFIGYYTASAKGGPPMSHDEADAGGLPTGSLYESIWYGVDDEGSLSVTIDSPQGSEKDYFFIPGKGVVVGGTKTKTGGEALEVAEYFRILNNKTRPNWWGQIIDSKRDYWVNWMQKRLQKSVGSSVKRFVVRKTLRFNIYWESN